MIRPTAPSRRTLGRIIGSVMIDHRLVASVCLAWRRRRDRRHRASAAPSPGPSPAPAPSATPSAPSDPCGSLLSIVNRPTVRRASARCVPDTSTRKRLHEHDDGRPRRRQQRALPAVAASASARPTRTSISSSASPNAETSSVGEPRIVGSSDISLASKYELGYSSNADWGIYGAVTVPNRKQGVHRRKRAVHRQPRRGVHDQLGVQLWRVRSASTR